jgi:hypothetical protein
MDVANVLAEHYQGMDWSLSGSPTTEEEFTSGFVLHSANGVEEPTWTKLQEYLTIMQAAYDAKEYQRKRQPEYPDIGEQLDALYHAGVFPTDMAAQIKAVKDKYAKE